MAQTAATAPASSERSASASTWLDVATLIGLIAGWLYLAGWAYAWRFFGHFQLGLLALDIPKEYFFIYGLRVGQRWFLLVIPGLLLVAGWTLSRRLPPRAAWGRHAVLLGLACLLFVAAYGMGMETGSGHYGLQRQDDFPAMPRVRLWLKPAMNTDTRLTRFMSELPQGCYRLMLLNRSAVFVMRPPVGAPPARLAVLALPLSEVQALQVVPIFTSCQE
jgi:hypothetical protein